MCGRPYGHTVSKYIGVGRASTDVFIHHVACHFKDVTHLCSDANSIYSKYCRKNNIIHYVRPSHYLSNLKAGRKAGRKDNELYNDQMIDYIIMPNEADLSYTHFKKIKEKYGLSLSHVNQVHSRLKQKLVANKHGVSLKYLDGYVCWETLLINYGVDYGHAPASRKDAEKILEILLKTNSNVLIREIRSKKVDFSSMDIDYQRKLIDKTEQYRKHKLTGSEYISSEDMGDDFNIRDFLEGLPTYMLKYLCDYCRIKGRSHLKKGETYRFKRALEAHPDIQEAIDSLIETYGTKKET